MEHTQQGRRNDSTADRAREEASRVGDQARDEAQRVAEEAKRQGQELYDEAVDRARNEARQQTSRAADGLRAFSHDLRSMAEESDTQTSVDRWARRGAGELDSFADRLDDRGIDGIVDDVSRFARRNPGTFLAAALGAGMVAGRVIRNVAAEDGHRRPRSNQYDHGGRGDRTSRVGSEDRVPTGGEPARANPIVGRTGTHTQESVPRQEPIDERTSGA